MMCLCANCRQDGHIQHEVKLTGCLSTNVLSPGEGPLPTHGTLLAPGLNAQVHQHFFCARLDMAVDDPHGGRALTVTEASSFPRCLAVCLLAPVLQALGNPALARRRERVL